MYNILVQFIGTIGVGGNIISQHKIYKNDKKEYLDLKEHFQIKYYRKTKYNKDMHTMQNDR